MPLRSARGGKSWLWARLLLGAEVLALLVVATGLCGHASLAWAPMKAFRVFFVGLEISVGLAFVALVTLVVGAFRKQGLLVYTGVVGLVLGLVPPVSVVAALGPSRVFAPIIHDISTDTVSPPAFVAARARRDAADNSVDYGGKLVAATQHAYYPDIQPLNTSLDVDQAFARALSLAWQLHWHILASSPRSGTIEATDQSRVFGFVDDIVIRVTPGAQGSRIDIRSASRRGLGDLGANAQRIRRFEQAFSNTDAGARPAS